MGWINDHYVQPIFHFRYAGFEWLPTPSPVVAYGLHALLIAASLLVLVGCWYRMAATVQFLVFTYLELIDLTYYLNHYYFVSLVALLLIFVPANRAVSIDVWRRPELRLSQIPRWTVTVFQLQLGCVYFFAGLWKINHDWLFTAVPMKIWLPAHSHLPLLGKLFIQDWVAYAFSWAGMIYDLTIAFFLAWSVSRPWAYITVVFFHLMTGLLFQIGVFPIVMIGATLIFFSPQWHERIWRKLGMDLPQGDNLLVANVFKINVLNKILLIIFFAFQLVFPLRGLANGGNIFWHEQGYRFSWRVMLMEKAGTATFYVTDPKTGREGEVRNRDFLNAHQEKQMSFQPDMILQFAHFLSNHYAQKDYPSPAVRAEVYVTLNGRPSTLLINDQRNLTEVTAISEIILPLQ